MHLNRYQLSRRRFMGLGAGALGAALAGCSSDSNPAPTPTSPAATSTPAPRPTATAGAAPTPSSLSLDQKIGEMLMLGFRGYRIEPTQPIYRRVEQGLLGNVVLFDFDGPSGGQMGRNIESPAQVKALDQQLQDLAPGKMLIAADQEGGYVARLKPAYGFPATYTALEMGNRNDLAWTREESRKMAQVLLEHGVNLNLAPVVDVDLNPDNPVIGEYERSFSSDPDKVTEQALAFIQGHHDVGVLTTLKHFPGHGSSKDDSHLGITDVTSLWTPTELEPFREIIRAGQADAVMTAHIFNENWDPDYPATLSKAVITGILRDELGFDGVVITDDMQMGAIRQYYGFDAAIELAINAGADMVAVSNNLEYDPDLPEKCFNAIKNAVTAGRIHQARIDESYRRIARLKSRLA